MPDKHPPPKWPRDFLLAEKLSSLFDAQVAAHDYAHMGYYFRIVHSSQDSWEVWLSWGFSGRYALPACCRGRKRTFVQEPPPPDSWQPRRSTSVNHHQWRQQWRQRQQQHYQNRTPKQRFKKRRSLSNA